MKRRLTKDSETKWFSGVIGGLANYFGLGNWKDAIRVLYLIGSFFSFGSLILFYFILDLLMPESDK